MEKGWGWWRLLPMYRVAGDAMPLYREYLCEYYIRNPPESVDGAASTDERVVRRSAWTNENGRLVPLARLVSTTLESWTPPAVQPASTKSELYMVCFVNCTSFMSFCFE
jgi:hypothetical protein